MRFLRSKIFSLETNQPGQALLFVIVAMVIALTVTLSVATRSVTNVKTSTEEANSQQAFSAAEAGVEQALRTTASGSSTVTYPDLAIKSKVKQIDVKTVSGSILALNNGNPVLQDDGVDVWLSTYPNYTAPWTYSNNERVNIYWGTSSDCNAAAIEAILVTGTVTNPITTRFVFDPCSARQQQNGFAASTPGTYVKAQKTFANMATISLSSTLSPALLLRIIPIYANSLLGIEGLSGVSTAKNFPAQGTLIQSVGASGEALRKISVYRGYPKVPDEFFANVLFIP